MDFTLDNFEDEIDPVIVERGVDYYLNNFVILLKEGEASEWKSHVAGSNSIYEVQIKLQDEEVISYDCDCPYDWGGACKHIVATLFAIRDQIDEQPQGGAQARGQADAEIVGRVDQVMSKSDTKDLLNFLREQLQGDQQMAHRFLMRFEEQGQLSDLAAVPTLLHRKLEFVTSPHGKRSAGVHDALADLIGEVYTHADACLREADAGPAIRAIGAGFETAIRAEAGLREGHEGLDEQALAGLARLERVAADPETTIATKEQLFEQCLALGKLAYEMGFEAGRRLYNLAASIADVVPDGARICNLYDELMDADCFEADKWEVRLALAQKWGGDAAETAYIQANLIEYELREIVIARAIQSGKLDYAAELAQTWQHYAENGTYAEKVAHYRQLIQIAVLRDDLPCASQNAVAWFSLESFPQIKTYKSIKAMFPAQDWPAVSKAMLSRKWHGRPLDTSILANVYVIEGWHDQLLELLQKEYYPFLLEHHGMSMPRAYWPALVKLWERYLLRHLENCNKRADYITACDYLKHIRKLGGQEVFDYMKKFMEEEFKKRPAFMAELRKL